MEPESRTKSLPCTSSAPEVAIGVTGNECAAFVDEEKRTLLVRDGDLEVEALSEGASDGGVSGTMRTVLSISKEIVLARKLL